MNNVIDLDEKLPKYLAIRISKMLEGREYGTIAETLGILVGATCHSATQIMSLEKAELFRKELLAIIENHSGTQETL